VQDERLPRALMDAALAGGKEAIAVPLVVVAVRVVVLQIICRIAKGGVAIDMVIGRPAKEGRCRRHC
jgi:hypothetical protein